MSDALERLRQRQRPNVPSRDVTLTSTPQDPKTTAIEDSKSNRVLGLEVSRSQDIFKSEVVSQENTQPLYQVLETKQSTLRLEANLSQRLQVLCRQNGLSREVLVEAMFEQCEVNSELLDSVLAAAQEKNQLRQHIANQRRAQSMMKRFVGS